MMQSLLEPKRSGGLLGSMKPRSLKEGKIGVDRYYLRRKGIKNELLKRFVSETPFTLR
jgi:hypothetical protein